MIYEPMPFNYEIFCTKTNQFHSFDQYKGADVFHEEFYEYLPSNDNTLLAGHLGSFYP